MQRLNKWGGLVTQASPYAVPPGGATQQVNLTLEVPGQLTSRGGMREVVPPNFDGPEGVVEQMWVISGGVGNPDKIVTLNDAGVVAITLGVA